MSFATISGDLKGGVHDPSSTGSVYIEGWQPIFAIQGQFESNGSEIKSPGQFRPNGSRTGKSLATCKDRVKVLSEFKLNGSKIWVGQMSLNRTGQRFGDPMGV